MKLLQKTALALIRVKLRLIAAFSPAAAARTAFRIFCTPQIRNAGEPHGIFSEAEILGPVFRTIPIRGYRWNKGGTTKAMVIHGFESSVVNFEHYIGALVKKGYEVIAFDAPAHGRSGGSTMNVLDYRDFILFIQQEYGPSSRFIAHSVGGLALALAIAGTQPNDGLRIALVAPLTESTSTYRLFASVLQLSPAVEKEFDAIIRGIAGHGLDWFSITRVMPSISASILWCHDRDDLVTPFADLETIRAENYPNIKFVFTDGLGHRRIYRDAGVTGTIIGFL
ncbi:MAG: alpha/beta fold hydrolase [Chitinophagaceae bacterium]|nr:MAG: alpha/beta fold hydrolase [Chitinophagaceae bacterium]